MAMAAPPGGYTSSEWQNRDASNRYSPERIRLRTMAGDASSDINYGGSNFVPMLANSTARLHAVSATRIYYAPAPVLVSNFCMFVIQIRD